MALICTVAVGLTVIVGAGSTAGGAGGAGVHVADCDLVMAGSASAGWRRDHLDVGPLGIRRHPLRDMTPATPKRPERGLATKAPILIEGHRTVTLRVPRHLRHRVFLYYGPDNAKQFTFNRFDGFSAIEFRPCAAKPRTIWPGGLRVIGRRPAKLLVSISGRPGNRVLRLGRPTLYRPPPPK